MLAESIRGTCALRLGASTAVDLWHRYSFAQQNECPGIPAVTAVLLGGAITTLLARPTEGRERKEALWLSPVST